MIEAQGGSLAKGLAVAPVQQPVPATAEGYVESIDALAIGMASLELGAGRVRKEDKVDHAAGLVIEAPVGAFVRVGDPLAVVHARSEELIRQVAPRLQEAWRVRPGKVERPPHVLARVDKDGVKSARIDYGTNNLREDSEKHWQ
jgi:thymidine phosphorylase